LWLRPGSEPNIALEEFLELYKLLLWVRKKLAKSKLCCKSFDSLSRNYVENLVHIFSEAVERN
jgi:hypothetical protein